jgi:hypothetical protein
VLTILVAALFAARPALADEGARARLLSGDVSRARVLLARAVAEAPSAGARAAAAELLFVADAWEGAGGPPPAHHAASRLSPAADGNEQDWEGAFAAARAALISGAYAIAAIRFDALAASAPELVSGARAVELRALAREALTRASLRAAGSPPGGPPPEQADEEDTAEEPARSPSTWYGWQTLISDGAALVTAPLVPPLGLATYLLGAPLVHLGHGRPLAGLGSLGLRAGAPILGGALGVALERSASGCSGDFCGLGGLLLGGVVGVATAVALDSAVLAREKAPLEGTRTAFVPSVTPRLEGGVDVGVGGAF